MVADPQGISRPSLALWINRFMFAAIVIIWVAFTAVAAIQGRLVVSRLAPLLLIGSLGVAYVATFRHRRRAHRVLGIVANCLVVFGTPLAFATSSGKESWWGFAFAMLAVLCLFGYPLVLFLRGPVAQRNHQHERA